MSSNYPAQVVNYVDIARTAAEEAQAAFKEAEKRVQQANEEVQEATRKAEEKAKEHPDLKIEEDITHPIRWRASRDLSAIAARAAEHSVRARRVLETIRKIADDAKGSGDAAAFEEAVAKADGYRSTAELWKNEVKKIASNAETEADAANAAEHYLNLEDFFGRQKDLIYERLESYDKIAGDGGVHSDMVFIAEGLPVVNGIINVGSSQKDYGKAIDWVKENWGDRADPLLVLSALVFIYVVDRGTVDHMNTDDMEQQATWERIRERVRRLL